MTEQTESSFDHPSAVVHPMSKRIETETPSMAIPSPEREPTSTDVALLVGFLFPFRFPRTVIR